MASSFQVQGKNPKALFTLKVHRGDGMALVAMNWKQGRPPRDFVGFAIEYREPGGDRFYTLKNRIGFAGADGALQPDRLSTRLSPIQKFRWVHFPRNAELAGEFVYRVCPVFMGPDEALSYGEPQEAAIALQRDTWPGKLNVCFTRGFVSSQAFVDRYAQAGQGLQTLLPSRADEGLDFVPSHPRATEALAWMGFEARHALLQVLEEAEADATAQVEVVAYDLSEREVVQALLRLAPRLRIIIDDSDAHGQADSAESVAAARLVAAGAQVRRQHLGKLQHNKTVVVAGKRCKAVVFGSTNFTWRGLYVQNNHALVARGAGPVKVFRAAFAQYWLHDKPADFGATAPAAGWQRLGLAGLDAQVTFSPHRADNAVLDAVAADVLQAQSSLFYSLAFLAQTQGSIREAVTRVTESSVFTYGMADRRIGGIRLETPGGNAYPVYPEALSGQLPEPFKSEPTGLSGGVGTRMHHKFIVIDFNLPSARVYLGSYNFSRAADLSNGENLVLIRDRRVAVSFMIEALRLFDHYHFRVLQSQPNARKRLVLAKPPKAGDKAWFDDDYTDARKARDRTLFA